MTRRTSAVAVCCSSASAEIASALAQFIEQARILDGDDGLGGEVLHQRDLLVRERAHILARNTYSTPTTSLSLSIGTATRVRAFAISIVATAHPHTVRSAQC